MSEEMKNIRNNKSIRSYQDITVDSDKFKEAAKYGFVKDDGSIFLKKEDSDILIDKIYTKDLDLNDEEKRKLLLKYVKAYYELLSSIDYLNTKIQSLQINDKDLEESIKILEKRIENPTNIIGPLNILRENFINIKNRVPEIKKDIESRKNSICENERENRIFIAEEIKRIATQKYSDFNQFKSAERQIRRLLLKWNTLRRVNIYNAHLDKAICDEIWQIIYDARKTFNNNKISFFKQHKENEKRIKDEKKLLIDKMRKINESVIENAESKAKQYLEEWKRLTSSYKLHSHVVNNRLWKHFKKELDEFYETKRESSRDEYLAKLNNYIAFLDIAKTINSLLKREKLNEIKAVSRYVNIVENAYKKFKDVPISKRNKVENLLKSLRAYVTKAKKAEWDKNDPEKIERANSFANLVREKNNELEKKIKEYEQLGKLEEIKALKNQIEINNKMLSVVQK